MRAYSDIMLKQSNGIVVKMHICVLTYINMHVKLDVSNSHVKSNIVCSVHLMFG